MNATLREGVMSIATSVRNYLDREHVPYDMVGHERTRDSHHSAKAAHVPGDQLAKCVILEDKKTGDLLMAVLPTTHKVDLDALYLRLNRRFELANDWELTQLFKDCETGAIPPLAEPYGLDCILDESLVGTPDIYFEAGDRVTLVHVKGEDFLRLTAGVPRGRISQHI
jgi:Ala-tRNA(Pro) deacylase